MTAKGELHLKQELQEESQKENNSVIEIRHKKWSTILPECPS